MRKPMIFDGKEFAREKEIEIEKRVRELRKKGITPKLVSIVVGDNLGSKLYTSLKKAAAERIGAEMEIRSWKLEDRSWKIEKQIQELNNDKTVHGIMVQLPFPKSFKTRDRDRVLNLIASGKDVDGLRPTFAGKDDSPFVAPVVKAVLAALKESSKYVMQAPLKVVVVGAKGFEGGKIVKELKQMDYEVEEVDQETENLELRTRDADILVSVTGVPDLIKADTVKDGVVLIDVGAPRGDVSKEAYEKASFVTPVPGGIGPVTIACLLENLIEAATRLKV